MLMKEVFCRLFDILGQDSMHPKDLMDKAIDFAKKSLEEFPDLQQKIINIGDPSDGPYNDACLYDDLCGIVYDEYWYYIDQKQRQLYKQCKQREQRKKRRQKIARNVWFK